MLTQSRVFGSLFCHLPTKLVITGPVVGVAVIVGVGVSAGVVVIVGVGMIAGVVVDGGVTEYELPDVLPPDTLVGVGVIAGVMVDGGVAEYELPEVWPGVDVEPFPAALIFGKKNTVPETRARTSITMMTPANTSPVFLRRIGESVFRFGAKEC